MGLSGDRIRECRILHRLTQEDVAKYLGIGKQAVYKYEIGAVTNIPLENIEKMAILFHTVPEYLAGWTDNGAPPVSLSSDEQVLLDTYRTLPQDGKQYVMKQLVFATMEYGGKSEDIPRPG